MPARSASPAPDPAAPIRAAPAACEQAAERQLVVGRIMGLYGVRGWVRVFSETAPLENILALSPWLVAGQSRAVVAGHRHGKGLVALLAGCDDRDQAARLVGEDIAVRRAQLPPPGPDEFYWADLEGLAVTTVTGVMLGRVERLFATGANDVLVVQGERERLLPFVWDRVIHAIDLEQGQILVDWDPDF